MQFLRAEYSEGMIYRPCDVCVQFTASAVL